MDFWQVLKSRHCVRNFDKNHPVNQGRVDQLIEAAKSAPSAGNLQDWHFEVVRDLNLKQAIAVASKNQDFIAEAPVVIIICADLQKTGYYHGSRGENLYAIQDTAAAAENLFLAATALGLGCCWVGAFEEKKIKKILNLKPNLRPVVVMPVGYPIKVKS